MNTQISIKKWFMVIQLAIAYLLITCSGCQQKPPRIYKVAYSMPKSAELMQNTGQSEWTSNSPYVSNYQYVSETNAQASKEYHLGVGDVLKLKIFQLLELDREEVLLAEVDRLGQIYLPLLNHVQVAGMTCEQVRNELILRLGREYIRDPKVDVSINKYGSKQVMVIGMIRNPGSLSLQTDNATLMDVITEAGGINTGAGLDIEILRGAYNPASSNENVNNQKGSWSGMANPSAPVNRELVPICKLFAEEGDAVNPVIYPGDIVNIPSLSDGYIYLSGEIEQPGAKPFRRPLNILQAVSCAGGVTRNAAEKKCKIIRRTSEGGEKIVMVNLENVKKGTEQNIILAQNDTIVMPVDPVKKFFNNLDDMFKRGVYTGVRMQYDAGADVGMPTGGGF